MTTSETAPAKAYDDDDLDNFVQGYVLGWLFFETLPPAEEEDEDWHEGASYFDDGPFFWSDLTEKSLAIARAHCREILDRIAHLIPGNRSRFEGTEFEAAGHDAALHCQMIGDGFDRPEWSSTVRAELVRLCDGFGGLEVEPSKGKIHIMSDNY